LFVLFLPDGDELGSVSQRSASTGGAPACWQDLAAERAGLVPSAATVFWLCPPTNPDRLFLVQLIH